MKKILLILTITLTSLSISAAPNFQSYIALKTSESYKLTAKYQFDIYCSNLLVNIGNPSNTQDELRVKYAKALLSSTTDSKVFLQVLDFLTNDTYLTNTQDWNQIESDLQSGIQNRFDYIFTIF